MTQKDKLKLLVLGKANPQLAMLSFMEQVDSEMKQKMESDMKLMKEEMLYEMERAIKEFSKNEMLAHMELIKGEKGDSGEDGHTPQMGKDYMTEEDVEAFGEEVMSRYKTPKDGVDGKTPTKEELVSIILPLIPQPVVVNGKDADEQRIITKVFAQIPKPQNGKDGKDAKPVDVEKIKSELIEYLNKKLKTIQGGKKGGGMGNVVTQSFAVSSATTSITLSNGVASGGSAIWLNYNGQQQQRSVHFTSTGGTNIPLLFTPADGTYIDVIYIRA